MAPCILQAHHTTYLTMDTRNPFFSWASGALGVAAARTVGALRLGAGPPGGAAGLLLLAAVTCISGG